MYQKIRNANASLKEYLGKFAYLVASILIIAIIVIVGMFLCTNFMKGFLFLLAKIRDELGIWNLLIIIGIITYSIAYLFHYLRCKKIEKFKKEIRNQEHLRP